MFGVKVIYVVSLYHSRHNVEAVTVYVPAGRTIIHIKFPTLQNTIIPNCSQFLAIKLRCSHST